MKRLNSNRSKVQLSSSHLSSASLLGDSEQIVPILNKSFYTQKIYPKSSSIQPNTSSIQANTSYNKVGNNQELQEQQYKSIHFLKQYYEKHSIQVIITQVMKEILSNTYLPINPYFGLFRELGLKCITENIQNTYLQESNTMQPSTNSITKIQEQQLQQPTLTQLIRIQSKQYHLPTKMKQYININLVHQLWKMIQSRQRVTKVEELLKKNKLQQKYFISMGGGIVMNLTNNYGNANNTTSNYTRDNLLKPNTNQHLQINYYLQPPPSTTYQQTPTQICQFILDDTINEMQSHSLSSEVNLILIKLVVKSFQKEMVIQWGIQQLVYDRLRIVKEIVKCLLSNDSNFQVYSLSYMTINSQALNMNTIIQVKKSYIPLITASSQLPPSQKSTRSQQQQSQNILNNSTINKSLINFNILSPMFQHVFTRTQYYEFLDEEFRLSEMEDREIIDMYRWQVLGRLVKMRGQQGVIGTVMEMVYAIVYDEKLTNKQSTNTMLKNLSNLFTTPFCPLYQLLLSASIQLSHPINSNQQYFYNLVNLAYDIIYGQQLLGDYLFQGTATVHKQLRVILSKILDVNKNFNQMSSYKNSTNKNHKVKMDRLLMTKILNVALSLLQGLKLNYLNHVYSIDQSIQLYLNKLIKDTTIKIAKNNNNNNNKTTNSQTNFINLVKLKDSKTAPQHIINVQQQTKHYKSILQTNDIQTQQLIITKYIQQQQLYNLVYFYHWQLIQGKKLIYPLTKLIQIIKSKAIQNDISRVKKQLIRLDKERRNNAPRSTTINQLTIYQISNAQCIFYSLDKYSLDQSTLPQYNKVYKKFLPYFLLQQQPALKQMAKYILSIQPIPALSPLAQQHSSINLSKMHADLIIKAYSSIGEIHNLMFTIISEFIRDIDRDGLGVVGIYSTTMQQQILRQQRICSWSLQQTSQYIRLDNKRVLNHGKFMKWLQKIIALSQSTLNNNIKSWINIVYLQNNIICSCYVGFNIYFMKQGGYQYQSLFNNNLRKNKYEKDRYRQIRRVFANNRELVEYYSLIGIDTDEGINNIEQVYNSNTQMGLLLSDEEDIINQPNNTIKSSIVKNTNQQQPTLSQSKSKPITLLQIRTLSPFYSHLQQSYNQLTTILHLITYTKTDRRQRFTLKTFIDQFSLLEYYLIDQCIMKYQFVYYQGVCIQVKNLVTVIKQFLNNRQDNLGIQTEILWLEMMVWKLMSKVKIIIYGIILEVKQVIKKIEQTN